VCGANLKVIGKAVALSEAIARSDRGPLPKFKEMIKNLKVDQVTEEVSRAFEKMSQEIAQITPDSHPMKLQSKKHERKQWLNFRKKKTAAERREKHISDGMISLFSGVGLTIFLYYLSASIVLKLPPGVIADIPFDIDSVVRVIWTIGLIPSLHGLGNIVAGLLVRADQPELPPAQPVSQPQIDFPEEKTTSAIKATPGSVTEHTTQFLT
jgi:hypothetical protein